MSIRPSASLFLTFAAAAMALLPAPSRGSDFDPLGVGARAVAVESGLASMPQRGAAPAQFVTPAGWSYESNLVARKVGVSAATAGDVNGDGYSDVATLGESGTSTALYVFHGSAAGLVLAPGYPLTNLPQATVGMSVAGVGDVNSDGFGDVAVGMAQSAGGTFRLYYGSPGGLQPSGFFNKNSLFGGSYADMVRPAGDVNGDGYQDVLVGSSQAPASLSECGGGPSTGAFEIYYGSPSGLNLLDMQVSYACQWVGAGSGFGRAIATAGDVNADGYDDVLIGATNANSPTRGGNVGAMWVVPGSASGLPSSGLTIDLDAAWRVEGYQAGGNFASAVAPAGDLDGDGYADVAVGAPDHDLNPFFNSNNGYAWVFAGSAAGPDTTRKLLAYTYFGQSHVGLRLASAGDQNGDGRPDLIIGHSNFFYVATSHGSTLWIQQNAFIYDLLSMFAETAGDVNGDGLSDMIVGDPNYTNGESQEGRLVLYYGVGDGFALGANWEITTVLDNPNLGWAVGAVGDVNGDGFEDFAVSMPTWNYFGADVNNGMVLLYYGALGGPSTSYGWYYIGSTNDQAGISLAAAGDVNGDGYGDIIIGAHQAGNAGGGKAYVFYGHSTGPSLSPDRTLFGATFGSQFGASVAGAGDVNGDGYADVIVGAPYDEGPTTPLNDEGRAFLYLGSAAGLGASPIWSDRGGQADAHYGSCVAAVGDANGDGFSDVAVAAPDFDLVSGPFTLEGCGRVSLYRGQASAVPLAASTSIAGSVGSYFGSSVAGAGDVNGDGYSDLVVGAPYWHLEGMVSVFAGSPSGISSSAMWTQAGGEAQARFGSSVASAGDVNGDGRSDVVIGAADKDSAGVADRGYAAVYLGPLPAGAAPLWDIHGPSLGANLGHSVANAGDVDGDGWSDLLFGMPGYTDAYPRQGLCYLFRGGGWGPTVPLIGFAYRPFAGRFVQPLGLTDPNLVYLGMTGRSAAGKTRVRLEWRMRPAIGLGAPTLAGQGAYLPTGAPGPNGSITGLNTIENRLANGIPYSWQVRSRSRSVYFPTSIWLSPARNGALEWDLRAPGTSVDVPVAEQAGDLDLAGAYPNPMGASSLIRFRLGHEGPVSLTIVDVQGRKVRELARGTRAAGPHQVSWDGRDLNNHSLGAGLYFVRLEAEGRVLSHKLTLLR